MAPVDGHVGGVDAGGVVKRRRSLNLATRGFSNLRPHRRAALTLAVVGLGLLGVNAFLYGRYQAGSAEIRSQLRAVETKIEEELQAVQDLEAALLRLDLEAQNEQVAFLNDRIAERTFPWSRLFDRLEEVLPPEVRLSSLNPTTESRGRRRGTRAGDESVLLAISGEAEGDEGLVAFLDALFSHPSFGDPNLVQESREGGLVRFQLSARYLPKAPGDWSPPSRELASRGEVEAGGETAAGGRTTAARLGPQGVVGAAQVEGATGAAPSPAGDERAAGPFVAERGVQGQGETASPVTQPTAAAPRGGAPGFRRPLGTTPVAGTPGSVPQSRAGSQPVAGDSYSEPEAGTPIRPTTASAPPQLRGGS